MFSLNSDMSSYLAQSEDLDREETRRLSDKVKAHARLTLETLDQVRLSECLKYTQSLMIFR